MSRNIFCFSLLIFYTVLFLNGCSAVNTNVNKYTLNGSCNVRQGCGSCCSILIAEPTAQPGYDTDQMIYMQCPYEIKSFSRNRWVAPPHAMLTNLIAQSFQNTGFFKAVVTAPHAGQNTFRLETRLMKFQHEFFCCPSRVRIVINATLIETCCRQTIAEKVFEVVVTSPRENPYGGVLAANQATRIILGQIAHFVICHIQHHPSLPVPLKIRIRE